jgi:hypothetical protein
LDTQLIGDSGYVIGPSGGVSGGGGAIEVGAIGSLTIDGGSIWSIGGGGFFLAGGGSGGGIFLHADSVNLVAPTPRMQRAAPGARPAAAKGMRPCPGELVYRFWLGRHLLGRRP